MKFPILMPESLWMNSQLSIARHYGRVSKNGKVWVIVNSRGMDLFECSIPAGEPADLVRQDFVKYYRKLGRDKFLEVLREHPNATNKELTAIYKEMVKPKKKQEEQTINFE